MIFCVNVDVFLFYILCIVDAHFFPFLSQKKNKEIGERKKKKDRGRLLAARRNPSHYSLRELGICDVI